MFRYKMASLISHDLIYELVLLRTRVRRTSIQSDEAWRMELASACCPTSILTRPVDSGLLGTDPNPSAILISRLAELVRRDVITLTRTLACTAFLRPG